MNTKEYTVNLTEEELLYIRSALCDKNLKHTAKANHCRHIEDPVGYEYNMDRRKVGRNALKKICEYLPEMYAYEPKGYC